MDNKSLMLKMSQNDRYPEIVEGFFSFYVFREVTSNNKSADRETELSFLDYLLFRTFIAKA